MAKKTVRTGVAGDTPSDRRALASVTAPTAAPSVKGDGVLLQRNEHIHIFWDMIAEHPDLSYFSVQLWWYSPISAAWHKGETFTVNADDLTTIESQGLDRVYIQITAVENGGGDASIDAWIGLVVPV